MEIFELDTINRLKDLQDLADKLCYQMIEAEDTDYFKLKNRLEVVEDEIDSLEQRLG